MEPYRTQATTRTRAKTSFRKSLGNVKLYTEVAEADRCVSVSFSTNIIGISSVIQLAGSSAELRGVSGQQASKSGSAVPSWNLQSPGRLRNQGTFVRSPFTFAQYRAFCEARAGLTKSHGDIHVSFSMLFLMVARCVGGFGACS